jgi:hypothetical protein
VAAGTSVSAGGASVTAGGCGSTGACVAAGAHPAAMRMKLNTTKMEIQRDIFFIFSSDLGNCGLLSTCPFHQAVDSLQ